MRYFIYFLGFVVPPFIVGTVTAFSTLMSLMTIRPAPTLSPESATALSLKPTVSISAPVTLVLFGEAGTEVSDVLLTYAENPGTLLSVAKERKLLPLTTGLYVMPDLAWKDSELERMKVERVVFPTALDPKDAFLLEAATHFAKKGIPIVTRNEAALILESLPQPSPQWERNLTRKNSPSVSDFLLIWIFGGFDWNRKAIAVPIFDGISERALSNILGTLPRTMSLQTVTFSDLGLPSKSKRGLTLVPTLPKKDLPSIDWVVSPISQTATPSWVRSVTGNPVFHEVGDDASDALRLISTAQGTPMKDFVTKMSGISENEKGASQATLEGLPWSLALRPLALGLLGIALVRVFLRVRASRKRVPISF